MTWSPETGVGMSQSPMIRRAGVFASAGLAALLLSACNDYVGQIPKHMAPLDKATRELVESKGMDQRSPILVRVFKQESALEVWKKQKATGRYALLKEYPICAWSGVLGPKLKEGDRQAPEGFYTIRPAQMNPNSSYHLSFNIGFPNDFDRAHGRTGTHLMVHGACSSAGCYSMTDEQIQEIYTLGRLAFEGGQREFQVQAYPFRMTAENLAKHRDNPNIEFWRMLKEGSDHFEVTQQPPKVDVCGKRYVFNSVAENGAALNASAACPALSVPDAIRVAVAAKAARDDSKIAVLTAKFDSEKQREVAAAPAGPVTAAASASMTVPETPVSLEPPTAANEPSVVSPAPAVAAAAPPPPANLQPAQSPAAPSAEATPVAPAPPAAPAAEVATAYAPEPQKSGIGGFFSRVVGKVNPF